MCCFLTIIIYYNILYYITNLLGLKFDIRVLVNMMKRVPAEEGFV